ncbi:MAG TPA: Uma2 family endonuclease, partial [Sphingomonas sp.]
RVEDYLLLDEAGAFAAYGKTELLGGEIVYMNAQHRPHARAKMVLYDILRDALRAIGSPLTVMVEVSVALSPNDAPEPDLTLTSEPGGKGLIPGHSVALVVEVSDTTLDDDLRTKQRIYAAAGVPEYWVADVNGRTIHQMWAPDNTVYRNSATVAAGDILMAATINGLTIDTSGL